MDGETSTCYRFRYDDITRGGWKTKQGAETERQNLITAGFEQVTEIEEYEDDKRFSHYLNDFDAILPLIQKHGITIKEHIKHWAKDERGMHILSLSPAQLSEGLLRVTGNWK